MNAAIRKGYEAIVVVVVLVLASIGCSRPQRLAAVPQALQSQATVAGLPGVRYRPGQLDDLTREAMESFERERAYLASQGQGGSLPPAVFLAISGGGDNGAFGAGLLNGWTAAGDRPTFKLVTGVSTGGLIAPFAYLGSTYDATLKALYTGVSPKDILEKRSILAALTDDAMADNRPLWHQLEKHVNREMLDAIAAEYQKGRLLLIGTTDLDARQGVIWNMTKIAASKDPRALDLFRKIMIASAAIPGAFPPTMIDVEADGHPYQEMHVDGGCSAQVFVYPPSLNLAEMSRTHAIERARRVYIIRNARLDPDWSDVERKTLSIAQRAIDSLIFSQGMGDLYRIYTTSRRDGVDFNLARIPSTFNAVHKEQFDTAYMRALFDETYTTAARGYQWEKVPPGLATNPDVRQ